MQLIHLCPFNVYSSVVVTHFLGQCAWGTEKFYLLSKSNFGFSGLGTTSSAAEHVSSLRASFGSASGGTEMTHAHRPGSEGFLTVSLFPLIT